MLGLQHLRALPLLFTTVNKTVKITELKVPSRKTKSNQTELLVSAKAAIPPPARSQCRADVGPPVPDACNHISTSTQFEEKMYIFILDCWPLLCWCKSVLQPDLLVPRDFFSCRGEPGEGDKCHCNSRVTSLQLCSNCSQDTLI